MLVTNLRRKSSLLGKRYLVKALKWEHWLCRKGWGSFKNVKVMQN